MSLSSVLSSRVSAALVFTAASALAQPAVASTIDFSTLAASSYDNTANTVVAGPTAVNNQLSGLFRDVWWWSISNGQPAVGSPDWINAGKNLVLVNNSAVDNGTGAFDALNFTGPAINGGQNYMAVYDNLGVPGPSLFDTSGGGLIVAADLLFVKHAVSAGVMALWGPNQDGLALLAKNGDGNNPDAGMLSLVFQNAGANIVLNSTALGSGSFCNSAPQVYGGVGCLAGDHWYRVILSITAAGDAFNVTGSIYGHQNAADPRSALLAAPITSLAYAGSLSDPDSSARFLSNPGQVGLVVQGNESIARPDNVGVSFYLGGPTVVPEPSTMVLLGTGLLLVARRVVRRKQ